MAKRITTAAPLPPRPNEKLPSVEKAIERMIGMLTELPVIPYDPVRERQIGEEMLHGLELELNERDRKRRELWGDRFPPKLNQKPPEGYVPINRVTEAQNGTGKPVVEGKGEGKGKKKSTKKYKTA